MKKSKVIGRNYQRVRVEAAVDVKGAESEDSQKVRLAYPSARIQTYKTTKRVVRDRLSTDKTALVGYVFLSSAHYCEADAWREVAEKIV